MNIVDFKKIYKVYDPCPEGVDAFENATSRREVFAIVTHPSYYDFVYRSIQRGWGPKPEDIRSNFDAFTDGRTVQSHRLNGVDCNVVLLQDLNEYVVPSNVRIVYLMGYSGTITVNDWDTVKIVCDSHTKVSVSAGPNSLTYVENYGGVINPLNDNIYIKRRP